MRADSTACGARINGSTALRWDATSRTSGGVTMTSTASASDSDQAFLGVAALLFVATGATTIVWCASMSAMGGMPMPGGWTMSMAWMRMPGQSWADAAASWLGMWVVMMAAMMMPSLVPMLWRYRAAVSSADGPRLG